MAARRSIISCCLLIALLAPAAGGIALPAVPHAYGKGSNSPSQAAVSAVMSIARGAATPVPPPDAGDLPNSAPGAAPLLPQPPAGVVAALPAEPAAEEPAPPPPTPPPPSVLDGNQAVVFYGTPLAAGLGILGMFPADEAAQRVRAQAAAFDAINGDRGVVPAFDLIYAIAADEPTSNGLYLRYLDEAIVQAYLDVAETYDLQLILDLQIGRGIPGDEVRKIERWLAHPRVHVAIDPEYAVGPHGAPILTPGRISGHDINEIQIVVSEIVARHNLPPKMVVIHQFLEDTIVEGEVTYEDPNVDLVLNMDAFGPADEKRKRYRVFSAKPYAEHKSFNIFLNHDDRVLSEHEVLELDPSPDIVFYQ